MPLGVLLPRERQTQVVQQFRPEQPLSAAYGTPLYEGKSLEVAIPFAGASGNTVLDGLQSLTPQSHPSALLAARQQPAHAPLHRPPLRRRAQPRPQLPAHDGYGQLVPHCSRSTASFCPAATAAVFPAPAMSACSFCVGSNSGWAASTGAFAGPEPRTGPWTLTVAQLLGVRCC